MTSKTIIYPKHYYTEIVFYLKIKTPQSKDCGAFFISLKLPAN